LGLAGAVAAIATIASLIYAGYQVVGRTISFVEGTKEASSMTGTAGLDQTLANLAHQVSSLQQRVAEYDPEGASERLFKLEAELSDLKIALQKNNLPEMRQHIERIEDSLKVLMQDTDR
jgi:hypothetical protein